MSTVYLDTSVLGRVLLREPDSPAIKRGMEQFSQQVGSRLLRVELRRLGRRIDRLSEVDELMSGVALIPISDDVLEFAGTIEPATVGTLDAIHLATAVGLAAGVRLDAVMTYDKRLADGARHHGLAVLSPS